MKRALFLLLLALCGVASAERRPLGAEEARRFEPVGRITSPHAGGSGTGVLISRDTVLTSAHIFDAAVGLKGFVFSFAKQRCALRSVRRFDGADVAIARVACPQNLQVNGDALLCAPVAELGSAVVVAFHADRAEGRRKQIQHCLYRRAGDATLLASCDAYHLASGAPLYVAFEGGHYIAGVLRGVGMPADRLGVPDWHRRYLVAATLPEDALELFCD